MGQCMAKKAADTNTFISRVQLMIEHNDILDLEFISRTEDFHLSFPNINEQHFKIASTKLNLLSLSAYYGSCDCFKFIHKVLNSSLQLCESLLHDQGASLIEIICTRGSAELLEYYIPHFTPAKNSMTSEEITESLNFTNNGEELTTKKMVSSHTAIQKACEKGNVTILAFVNKYYQGRPPPVQLDIEYQDEATGENCALIACRRVNYTMIKFLNQTCKSNFMLLNKQGESAIQIMAATHKRDEAKDFYECFVYLVNQIGVDILYNYEETLLLIKCEKTFKFLEKKLKERGVEINKTLLKQHDEDVFKPNPFKSVVEERIETFGKDVGFCALYGEIMDKDDELSVIKSEHRADTPFGSILEVEP